jgi:hypothetical protein
MIQFGSPLPAGARLCVEGHRPHFVETRGNPIGYRGTPCPRTWHVECPLCGIATEPTVSRAIAELRWSDPDSPFRIPLSEIGRARMRAAAIATAA